jgi:hypothetical protein
MTEVDDLRAATREAHEAIKDLRAATRDALDVLAQVKIAAKKAVDEDLADAIREGLVQFHDANAHAIADSEAAIYDRFAKIGDILLGEDRNSRKAGSAIQDLAQQWVAERT